MDNVFLTMAPHSFHEMSQLSPKYPAPSLVKSRPHTQRRPQEYKPGTELRTLDLIPQFTMTPAAPKEILISIGRLDHANTILKFEWHKP